jgi:type IV secretion system protein VirB3
VLFRSVVHCGDHGDRNLFRCTPDRDLGPRHVCGVGALVGDTNLGVTADPLFVGATRPPMRWGVTYSALLVNGVFTMEIFLLTKNLLTLALALPIHGICALLCARDARFFDLLLLWGRTRIPALLANARFWRSSCYTPLTLDLRGVSGRRRTPVDFIGLARIRVRPE